MRDADTAEQIAERFHEAYERLAAQHGYLTRKESSVPWPEVPERNKDLMVAVVTEVVLPRLVEAAERTEAQAEAEISTRVYHYEERIAELESQVEAAKNFSYASHRRRAEAAEAERDAALQRVAELETALRQMLNGRLLSMPGVNPDGSVSTSSMAETLARAALGGPATKEQP